jgi:hypothetical protein
MTFLIKSGLKRFKYIVKHEKKFAHTVNQAKLRSYNTSPCYKYEFEAPRSYEQALCLDKRNGNKLWGDATVLELTQIDDFVTFIDKGHHT